MFPDYDQVLKLRDRTLRADRRQAPRDNEIRLRVKRMTRVYL
ncbi:MAG TPA: hypothetical protein VF124_06005 [Gaiellaceae bacterium]|jgi:hypothetical protein